MKLLEISARMSGRGWKRRLLVLALLVCAGVGLAAWLGLRTDRQPLHKGRSIKYWVDIACRTQNPQFEKEVAEIGPSAVPNLVAKLRVRDTRLRRTYRWLWLKLPSGLRNKLPEVEPAFWAHRVAMGLLAGFGQDAEPAVPELIRLMDENRDDLPQILFALESIGSQARQAVPALRRALSRATLLEQVNLAGTIWMIGKESNVVVEILAKPIAQDLDDSASLNATSVARRMGPHAAPLASALVQLATNRAHSTRTRSNAALAAGELGFTNETVIAALLEGTRHPDLQLRADCAMVLWRINPKYASLAVPIVVEMLVDKKKRLAGNRTDLLDYKFKKLDFNAAIPALNQLLKSDSAEVRQEAANALKRIESETTAKDPKTE